MRRKKKRRIDTNLNMKDLKGKYNYWTHLQCLFNHFFIRWKQSWKKVSEQLDWVPVSNLTMAEGKAVWAADLAEISMCFSLTVHFNTEHFLCNLMHFC